MQLIFILSVLIIQGIHLSIMGGRGGGGGGGGGVKVLGHGSTSNYKQTSMFLCFMYMFSCIYSI